MEVAQAVVLAEVLVRDPVAPGEHLLQADVHHVVHVLAIAQAKHENVAAEELRAWLAEAAVG